MTKKSTMNIQLKQKELNKMNNIVKFNPVLDATREIFKQSIADSPLDFQVSTDGILLKHYTDMPECSDKKAVIKHDDDGNPVDWWVVGSDYHVKSHNKYFGEIHNALLDNIEPAHLEGVEIDTRSSRGGRWGMQQFVFPNVNIPIETKTGHNTTINMRINTWTALDSMTANNYIVGAYDGFCTNGMVFSQLGADGYTKRYKRNTKGFDLEVFTADLIDSVEYFYRQSKEFQQMADSSLALSQGIEFIKNVKSFSKAKEKAMIELYTREVADRGPNVFSLHSALTNYSSHRNDDLFRTRKTKHEDVEAEILLKREEEVINVINTQQFQSLIAA